MLKIKECQKQFDRFSKRCVEVSPSLIPPGKATRKESVSIRTKLNFTPVEGDKFVFMSCIYALKFFKWIFNIYMPMPILNTCMKFLKIRIS